MCGKGATAVYPPALGIDPGRLGRIADWQDRHVQAEEFADSAVRILRCGQGVYFNAAGGPR
jgi:hypothetical protein